jgi:asparagine synthase (glutamine-hydrolysing)
MCGIIVSESKVKLLKEGLKKIEKRGPDMSRVIEKDNHLFMFNRLSIMGLEETGMQPFLYKDSILVANGEIYNYKEIKKSLTSYTFTSDSDCEVLLPLYQEVGTDMFELLDAEFAIVLYDGETKSFVAGRDPIGIRPLFYGYAKETSKIIFSSEVKGIIEYVDHVMPFPPGHFYKDGEFVKYTDIYGIKDYHKDMFEDIFVNIREKLVSAVVKRLDSDAPIGFMLSGGLDSSLVCSIASQYMGKPIRTFSIGMEHDAIDLSYAKKVAEYIGSEHTEVIITKEDVLGCLDEVIYNLESFDITTVRASIGMYLLAKYINKNTDIKVLLTGEVSDEIFGYKYTDYAPDEQSFQDEADKRLRELYMYDVLRADRCLASNSLEARVPFGDIDFVRYVMKTNPIFKMNRYNMGKFILRKSFEGDYLPTDILYRDKAAFSDAVGHSLVDYLKEYAEGYYTDEEFVSLQDKHSHPRPKTKESLLYLEIFMKYYPNHNHLIKDYWMPNKEWENCDVDDPSARVLANYGKSGDQYLK